MSEQNPSHLTTDEVTLLIVAAWLDTLVKEYAELLTFTEGVQTFWDEKIVKQEMVRIL